VPCLSIVGGFEGVHSRENNPITRHRIRSLSVGEGRGIFIALLFFLYFPGAVARPSGGRYATGYLLLCENGEFWVTHIFRLDGVLPLRRWDPNLSRKRLNNVAKNVIRRRAFCLRLEVQQTPVSHRRQDDSFDVISGDVRSAIE